MTRDRRSLLLCGWLAACPLLACRDGPPPAPPQTVRFATYNTSLNVCWHRNSSPCLPGGLLERLATGEYQPARQIAETIQRVRPDIILLNEFNYDEGGAAASLFQEKYLSVGQQVSGHPRGPAAAIEFPYRYFSTVNTGIHSGFDLNNDGLIDPHVGTAAYAEDAFGYGEFPGRYGMLVLSRFPIVASHVRTFQKFLWKDMPGALLPDDPSTDGLGDWFDAEELMAVRLSSKSHWDIPIQVNDHLIHLLASHPTPPVFDGPEDRNGRRNHDEIRFWADYIDPQRGEYIVDDAGAAGGLTENASFVVVGDLNADPHRGDSRSMAVRQLTDHPRVNQTFIPTGAAGNITADFGLRVDYVLPSANLQTTQAGVFAPATHDPLHRLLAASDHRLVWVDVNVVPEPSSRAALGIGALLWLHAAFRFGRTRDGRSGRPAEVSSTRACCHHPSAHDRCSANTIAVPHNRVQVALADRQASVRDDHSLRGKPHDAS